VVTEETSIRPSAGAVEFSWFIFCYKLFFVSILLFCVDPLVRQGAQQTTGVEEYNTNPVSPRGTMKYAILCL
jgi:hypothetical protein